MLGDGGDGDFFDGGEGGKFVLALGTEVFELTGGDEDASFEGRDGAVVGFDGFIEPFFDVVKMVDEGVEALVQGVAEGGDLKGIFCNLFMSP